MCHQGYRDVERHIKGTVHQSKSRDVSQSAKITNTFISEKDGMCNKVISAEVKFAAFMLEHNLPIATADHAGPLFRSMFPDSKIATYYGAARTKTTSIINRALAPEFATSVADLVRKQPFTLSLDGSNEQEEQKLVPLTVRVFDPDLGKVVSRFLHMCLCSSGTAQAYFDKVEEVFTSKSIPWYNCIGFSVNSTSVNVGRHNSIKTRLETKNPAIYTLGCPCHFIHNSAHKAAKQLEATCGFDVEEAAVDIFYFFDHSTKRKGQLREFAQFCDIEYRKMLKYVSTRWLSLQTSVERILKQYPALRSYFLSQDESESDRRLSRLQALFRDPMSEAYLLFFNSVMPVFTSTNLLLQRDSPCIHILRAAMEKMLQRLMGRFVTVSAMDLAKTVIEVEFANTANQLSDRELMIGFTTKQLLVRLQEEVEPSRMKKFYAGVRAFFTGCVAYLVGKFPWDDEILQHASFIDFEKRKSCSFTSVEYFVGRFTQLLPFNVDELYDEFRLYQSLPDIPPEVDASLVRTEENEPIQADIFWNELEKVRDVNGKLKFGLLASVAKLVSIFPHSNADEERVFSLVRKNKTAFRANMSLETTLPSILHCKVNFFAHTKCFDFRPSAHLLQNANRAMWQYNKEH